MIKKCFTLIIIQLSQNMIIKKKNRGWKMKDEAPGVVIEEFVRLKPKMYSYLVNVNGEHKK